MTQQTSDNSIPEVSAEPDEFMGFLRDECLYLDVRRLPDGRYAAIYPLMFTHAIITVRAGDYAGVEQRWCYHTKRDARAAMAAWDGTGEPQGWHRHTATGRRRPDGNADLEYVAG